MNSLYTRLSITFLFILLALGSFILWDTHRSSERYLLEFTQQLNSPIAMYMAENAHLVNAQGLDREALRELASHVMIVNPSAEVYLLDPNGKVVAHSRNDSEIQQAQIALEPLNTFISGDTHFPLLSDNPLNANEKRIFSAHPLEHEGTLLGYVYVILAGEQHATLLAKVRSSQAYKSMAWTILCAVLLAIVAGFLLFFKLTRRLQHLTNSVLSWHNRNAADEKIYPGDLDMIGDEIDRLGTVYAAMTRRLLDQNEKLLANDKERREFYANISHDLRTPLTTLQGYLETILLTSKSLSDEQQHKHLQIALKQSQRLQHLITQLFDLTRLTSDHYKLNPESFSLLELCYDVVQDFSFESEKKSVELRVVHDTNDQDSLNVLADIALIQRVFENLIDNALRFTPRGGRVSLELTSTQDRVSVAVHDTGTGISQEAIRQIFTRHYTATPDSKQQGKHAGLGLSIVNHIVGLHGSKVDIQSEPGEGTRFRFYLTKAAQKETHSVPHIEVA